MLTKSLLIVKPEKIFITTNIVFNEQSRENDHTRKMKNEEIKYIVTSSNVTGRNLIFRTLEFEMTKIS